MGSSDSKDYCAFTKAVENLGDRWSLLIVRELAMFGPQGFNNLASGLPGSISRSVLVARLRRLEEIGVVARITPERGSPYQLAPAGQQLVPTLMSLWQWAEHWVPEDLSMAQRDPTVVMWWLTHRIDIRAGPERQVVLELAIRGSSHHGWILVARDTEPTLCAEDPLLDPDRYVYVDGGADALLPIARGIRGWADAIADRSVHVSGNPALVGAISGWFMPADAPSVARVEPAAVA